MGFSVMLWGAEKLVPAEYWCPYGTPPYNQTWIGRWGGGHNDSNLLTRDIFKAH